MIHDSTSHRFFKVDELTRLIARQLVSINKGSAVNLACASRCLAEPVLSTLWERQQSLDTLLKVLPKGTWDRLKGCRGAMFRIIRDPSPEAWNRVHRYASWMHQLRVGQWPTIAGNTFRSLRDNSPADGWFPALQDLSWCIARENLSHFDLFFSPHLKKISISVSWTWNDYRAPCGVLPAIVSSISALAPSLLQILLVEDGNREMPWARFKDSFSSVVLRCGPSLTEFASPVSLSDEAVNHLIRLPHLRIWRVKGPPPSYSASSLPLLFPPLVEITLGEGAARGWLSLFERLEDRGSPTQTITPLSGVRKSLKSLKINNIPGLTIDVSFTSPIQIFRNLVDLNVLVSCHNSRNEGQCSFKLNNDDVTKLAIALPRLESLLLGHPCYEDTCATTVACLLPISIHCVKLRKLEIHFNTTNIVDDLKNISEDPRFQELRSLPRCTLTYLRTGQMPLALDEPDFEMVANGMVDIFPSLECCAGAEETWCVISKRIAGFREHGRSR